ncbi:HEPN domain-containing protein [Mycolicibacterium sp. Y3]
MANTPIHPFLWDLTLPAVRAGWRAGQQLIEDGKPVSRIAIPEYEESDSGWPHVVATDSNFSTPASAPVKWTVMFTTQPPSFGAMVVVGDVPDLSAALEGVRTAAFDDLTFARGMNAFADAENKSTRDGSLEWEYLRFVGSIIGRAVALDVSSDEDVLDIYMQLEKARFAPDLRGDLVAPLTLIDLGIDEPVDLGGGVTIEPLTAGEQCARALSFRATEGISPYLVAAATHAVVVKDIKILNQPYAARIRSTGIDTLIGSEDVDKIDRAVQCVHIITEDDTGYNQVYVRPDGWADGWTYDLPPVWKIDVIDNYPANSFRAPWNAIARNPLLAGQVGEVVAAFNALAVAPNDVKLAARRSVRAMMRANDEDRTLDATIGIEALLMEGGAELKYRMAMRAAAALCDEFQPTAVFELARRVYDHRSEIAHGSVKSKPSFQFDGEQYVSADIAPLLLRALLRSRLISKAPWAKDTLEARILAGLALHGRQSSEVSTEQPAKAQE